MQHDSMQISSTPWALMSMTLCAGVEMEALTAVSTAALTVYDMCKAITKTISITDVRLEAKSGGRSGQWTRRS